jgi:hypothetical protein
MKKQIRFGVFETNSSSVHSLTIVSKEEFEKFKKGELVLDTWNHKLIPISTSTQEDDDGMYESYDGLGGQSFETFEQSYTTANGEEIVAFGYYGQDG